jgi:hypothetical protein
MWKIEGSDQLYTYRFTGRFENSVDIACLPQPDHDELEWGIGSRLLNISLNDLLL